MTQAIRWRTLSLVMLGSLLGAAGAWSAHHFIAPNLPPDQLTPLVWIVISVPLGAFIGSLLARPRRWAQSAGWIGVVYFFSIFGAARLERLLIGKDAAAAAGHRLYFTLVILLQVAGSLAVAWHLTSEATNDKL
ncbi:MAG: hypothetical protein H0T53_13880 [Herpetosiphonaceae bacterium]|nr:hypothetical protein [Herpetosiphonaceae bacterium]